MKLCEKVRYTISKFLSGRCYRCKRKLTDEEKHYYGNTCEKCERKLIKEIK